MEVATAGPTAGTIKGEVADARTGAPLPGANVMVVGSHWGASSDLGGAFIIPRLIPGRYSLRASMMGYAPQEIPDVTVRAGETTYVRIELRPTVVEVSPIVVTASRSALPLDEAAHSMAVLSSAEIAARSALRMDQALQYVPGVHFVGNHINIRACSGYSRGAGTRVLFLVDGVPAMAGDTGEINWDILPVLDIERIEVVKGAASALYGSNALGGVIQVITRPPSRVPRTLFRMTAGVYDRPIYPEWRWTERTLHYDRVDIHHARYLGPVGVDLTLGRHESTGYQENGHFRRYNASVKIRTGLPWGGSLTLYTSYENDKRGEFIQWLNQNHPFVVPVSDRKIRARINALNAYLRYAQALSPTLSLEGRISLFQSLMGNQYRRSGDFNPAYGLGGELQINYLPHPKHSFTAGLEYKRDIGHNKYIGRHRGEQVGPFLQHAWRPLSWASLVLGARWDTYHLVGEPFSEDRFSPRLGLTCKPIRSTSLRFAYGKGFRAASVTERFLRLDFAGLHIVPNPGLKSETSENVEIGLRQQLSGQWYVDVATFRSDYWNLIEAVPDPFLTVQFQNVTRARIQGLDLTSEGSWWGSRLGLRVGLTLLDHRDLVYKLPLAYRPRRMAVVSPWARLGPVELNADYRYASRVERVQLFTMDPRVPMKVLDLRLTLHLGRYALQLAANNALAYYYTFIERNMAEVRNFSLTLSGSL
ncbi:MAG: TonB-dependent receptor [candidate division KSB1 bacterium]|nr:TonB-dependent receptor [candidate division KSB1 bacterium]